MVSAEKTYDADEDLYKEVTRERFKMDDLEHELKIASKQLLNESKEILKTYAESKGKNDVYTGLMIDGQQL